ncbi:hypothetical protein DPEC_G00322350 [Dallia pectoralis]|uniref:Uncharacterized protein n=1 Tax=Dallia pectoralis TaxID=75939 RepID=A0ACC2FAP4_DALPE|nr:hypothetical protein DPEC_G00322350 [Dallia pectoralis]
MLENLPRAPVLEGAGPESRVQLSCLPSRLTMPWASCFTLPPSSCHGLEKRPIHSQQDIGSVFKVCERE